MDLWQLGVAETAEAVRSRKVSPVELVESLLCRIDALDPQLRAWVTVDREGALAQAQALAARAARGEPLGLMGGVPVGIKDIFYTKGLRTTACSKVLADFVPAEDAAAVALLRRAGAVILGKLQTTEFACMDPAPTRNPWDLEHTPGGSSAGSGVAVAVGMAPAATGSQTGGSTLRPAAYNGVVGLKPTYGLVSSYGVIPVAWSLDHVGILARSVEDAALFLEAIARHDPRDPASARRRKASYGQAARDPGRPPRLGLARDYFLATCTPEVRAHTEQTVARLESAGARVVEVRLPESFDRIGAAHALIMACEAAAYHERQFAERGHLYGPKIAAMVRQGLATPAAEYARAIHERPGIVADLERALRGVDALLTPSTPAPAPRDLTTTGDLAFQRPWSYCGLPTVSLPSGLAQSGLPLGVQLIGGRWRDAGLLRTARWCEAVLDFTRHPPQWRTTASGGA